MMLSINCVQPIDRAAGEAGGDLRNQGWKTVLFAGFATSLAAVRWRLNKNT
jgi:hypothetical protein